MFRNAHGKLRMTTIRIGMMRWPSVEGHQVKGRSGAAAGRQAEAPLRHLG